MALAFAWLQHAIAAAVHCDGVDISMHGCCQAWPGSNDLRCHSKFAKRYSQHTIPTEFAMPSRFILAPPV